MVKNRLMWCGCCLTPRAGIGTLKATLEPPENRWDERWLEIPAFLRRQNRKSEEKQLVKKPNPDDFIC
jgi:hypothetical protein